LRAKKTVISVVSKRGHPFVNQRNPVDRRSAAEAGTRGARPCGAGQTVFNFGIGGTHVDEFCSVFIDFPVLPSPRQRGCFIDTNYFLSPSSPMGIDP
jgi:hypothetical protein